MIKQLLQHSNSEVQDTMDVSFFIFYEFSLRGKNRHLDRIFCCELIGYDWIGTRDGHADIFGDAHRCVCRIYPTYVGYSAILSDNAEVDVDIRIRMAIPIHNPRVSALPTFATVTTESGSR